MDPAATQILKRMTDYLGSLKQFSVNTQGTLEDMNDSGHRVDFDVSARAIVSRPNKIFAERRGDLIDQNFYYDGKTLTLCNPADKVYATVPAPATIDGTLHYVRDSLGLIIPIADLVYSNSFPLLMQDVTSAAVVGKAVIGGVKCDHLTLQPPGCGLPGVGRGQRKAAADEVCRHRHRNPRAAEHLNGPERLERGSSRARCPVHLRAAPGGQADHVHAI